MEDLWRRLDAWAKKSGAGSAKLRGPASREDIALAEGTIEMKFPEDFRESLGWHDGQKRDPDFAWLPGCSPLQPLDAIVARWQEERGRRIPIAGSPSWDGDNTYLDLEPQAGGAIGQLIVVTAGDDEIVLGRSFQAALERYVLLLERGRLVWDAGRREVRPADGPWPGHAASAFATMQP
jgi:cell wall assembly regulator SMI1